MGDAATLDHTEVAPEDVLRARVYDLLGSLLRDSPSKTLLSDVAALKGDDTPLGQGIGTLAKVASATGPEKAKREFHDLFVGLGRGELLPYASYYMIYEPEDNIGSLCEMMAGLILGRFGPPAALSVQKDFFATHISPWAAHFFTDLESAEHSLLYAPVGTVGARFMEIEKQAFRMTE